MCSTSLIWRAGQARTARREPAWSQCSTNARSLVANRPALFEIAFHRADPAVRPRFRAAAAEALSALARRFEPFAAAGLLGGRSVPEAVLAFHGLCEGMAVVEPRCIPFDTDHERMWRDALRALLTGLAT